MLSTLLNKNISFPALFNILHYGHTPHGVSLIIEGGSSLYISVLYYNFIYLYVKGGHQDFRDAWVGMAKKRLETMTLWCTDF